MRIKIPYLITVIISVLLVLIGHGIAVQDMFVLQMDPPEVARASVQRVVERIQPEDSFSGAEDYDEFGEMDEFFLSMLGERIIFEARVSSGARRGQIITA